MAERTRASNPVSKRLMCAWPSYMSFPHNMLAHLGMGSKHVNVIRCRTHPLWAVSRLIRVRAAWQARFSVS